MCVHVCVWISGLYWGCLQEAAWIRASFHGQVLLPAEENIFPSCININCIYTLGEWWGIPRCLSHFFWLLHSFCPIFHDDPQALEERTQLAIYGCHLGPVLWAVVELLDDTFPDCGKMESQSSLHLYGLRCWTPLQMFIVLFISFFGNILFSSLAHLLTRWFLLLLNFWKLLYMLNNKPIL